MSRDSGAHVLLVHGGAHGAWCWDSVVALLRAGGWAVTAFDLPGSGADPTPRRDVTLSSYVAAVVARIDGEPGPVRLVGHSIAGFTLPAVVAARPNRVSEVVLVAAAVVPPGGRGIDTIPPDRRPGYYTAAAATPDHTLLPDFTAARQRFFTDLSDDAARAAYDRLTPQPFGVYLETVTDSLSDWRGRVRYLAFADDRNFLEPLTRRFADRAGAKYRQLPGDHCGMLSAPAPLAAALGDVP